MSVQLTVTIDWSRAYLFMRVSCCSSFCRARIAFRCVRFCCSEVVVHVGYALLIGEMALQIQYLFGSSLRVAMMPNWVIP